MSTTTNYNDETLQNPQMVKPASQEPGYVEQASGMLSSVAATASSYLPTSVTNAVAGVTGTGTSTTGVGGHPGEHGGVGDLGTQESEDVARLPEERQNPNPLTGNQSGANLGASNPAFDSARNTQMEYNSRQPGQTFPSGNAGVAPGISGSSGGMSGMSSTTGTGMSGVGGHPGQPGGVGDLGTMSTADVALLPEERANPDPLSNTSSMGMKSTGSYGVGGHPGAQGGVGDLGTRSEADVAVLPDERGTPSTQATEDAAIAAGGLGGHDGRHHDMTKKGSTGGYTGASYDVDHGLGMPHTRSMAPNDMNTNTNASTTSPSSDDVGTMDSPHQSNSNVDRRESENLDDVPSPKEAGYPTGKPKIMDKIKGSIMVAQAKRGHDEEKLQKGTMLKETGKAVNPEEEARRAGESL